MAERGLSVEARTASVIGTQNAAGLVRTMTSNKTGQIVGTVACDGLNSINSTEILNQMIASVWGEHIWLAPDARSFPNFRGLMSVAADRFRASGSQMAFMEFNDRAKMSLAEMIQDVKVDPTVKAYTTVGRIVGSHYGKSNN